MARVLLLEDDPDQLELRRMLLESAGHEVRPARNAAEAIASAAGADVVVLDLVPDFEDLLSSLPQATRVIVLSGRDVVSDDVTARSACLLRKPCPSRKLIEAIEWTLRSR